MSWCTRAYVRDDRACYCPFLRLRSTSRACVMTVGERAPEGRVGGRKRGEGQARRESTVLSRTANSIRVRVRVRVPKPVASDPFQSIKEGLLLGSLFITTVPRVFLPSCRRQVHPLPRGRRAALPFRRVEVAFAAVSTALQQRASHPPACATSSSLFSSRLPPHHLSTNSL